MKIKIYFILLISFQNIFLFSQVEHKGPGLSPQQQQAYWFPIMNKTNLELPCSPQEIITNCNLIKNNNFIPGINYIPNLINMADPFGLGLVPNWGNSHGSPQLSDFTTAPTPSIAPPFGVSNYAASGVAWDDINSPVLGEGIVQKIPPLTIGSNYYLQFFERFIAANLTEKLNEVNIVLIKCADYVNFNENSYSTPIVPTNSQTIFCQTNFNITNWQKVRTSFTANDNYDMIWIYPKTNTIITGSHFLLFTLPELIKINDFTINISPFFIDPTVCKVTLTPSCILHGATYTWTSPNGLQTTGNSINFFNNIAGNYGNWTVTMNVPSIVSTNNICDNLLYPLTATVNIPNCNQCINLPLIQ